MPPGPAARGVEHHHAASYAAVGEVGLGEKGLGQGAVIGPLATTAEELEASGFGQGVSALLAKTAVVSSHASAEHSNPGPIHRRGCRNAQASGLRTVGAGLGTANRDRTTTGLG